MGRRKKKREKTDDEQFRDWLCLLGDRSYKLDLLAKARGQLVCTDEQFSYYTVTVEGLSFMYRKTNNRLDGRKMYRLNDPLGAILGFTDYHGLRYLLQGVQWWRGWISPQSLKQAIWRYINHMKQYT